MIGKDTIGRGCEIKDLISQDGTRLKYRRWFWRQPKAVCICIAGVESHGGWYETSSSRLFENGFSVYFLDRRGSGLSDGRRGDVRRVEDLYGDIRELIAQIRSEHRDCPVFLLSISWGAKLGLGFCLKYPKEADGLILVTPGLAPRVGYNLKEKIDLFFSAMFSPLKLFRVPIPDARYFTRDPRYVDYIENDNLRLIKVTARFCRQTFALDNSNRRHYHSLRLPVGLFLAGQDRIIDNDRVKRVFEGLSSEKKRVYYYDDASHTLEFDLARDRFIQDLCEFMESLL